MDEAMMMEPGMEQMPPDVAVQPEPQGPEFMSTQPEGMAAMLMQMLGVAAQSDQQQLAAMQQQAIPGALELIIGMLSESVAPPEEGYGEGAPVSSTAEGLEDEEALGY